MTESPFFEHCETPEEKKKLIALIKSLGLKPKNWEPDDVHIDKINKEMSRKPHYGKKRRD